jgi:hypothetical protein
LKYQEKSSKREPRERRSLQHLADFHSIVLAGLDDAQTRGFRACPSSEIPLWFETSPFREIFT